MDTKFKKGQTPWIKGKKHSDATREKIKQSIFERYPNGKIPWNKGKKWDKTITEKISKTKIGSIPWNKGKKGVQISWNKGKRTPEEVRLKQVGKKSHLWKGGITKKNELVRKGIKSRLWREAVFARDNWTCQKYGYRGEKGFGCRVVLHPHHIQNFAEFPELRFAIDNGITLSKQAHYEFHKNYGYKNNTREQIKEFLK